jgi:hypothetical protein
LCCDSSSSSASSSSSCGCCSSSTETAGFFQARNLVVRNWRNHGDSRGPVRFHSPGPWRRRSGRRDWIH